MARKKKNTAIFNLVESQGLRFEFLKRNPDFVAEVKELERMPGRTREEISERHKRSEEIAAKWRLPFVSTISLDRNWMRLPVRVVDMGGRVTTRSQALALMDRAKREVAEMEKQGEWGVDFPSLSDRGESGRYVTLQIDTAVAVDDLLPVIEKTLRDVYRAKRIPRRPVRPTAARFQLEVFDRAADTSASPKSRTFAAIAAKMHRPVSTVKSAYLIAAKKIFGPSSNEKRKVPLAGLLNFRPQSHIASCSQCGSALRAEEMCNEAQLWMNQDAVSQRELTGYDSTEEVYRKRKRV